MHFLNPAPSSPFFRVAIIGLVTEYCTTSLDKRLASLSSLLTNNPAAAEEEEVFSDHANDVLCYVRAEPPTYPVGI